MKKTDDSVLTLIAIWKMYVRRKEGVTELINIGDYANLFIKELGIRGEIRECLF